MRVPNGADGKTKKTFSFRGIKKSAKILKCQAMSFGVSDAGYKFYYQELRSAGQAYSSLSFIII